MAATKRIDSGSENLIGKLPDYLLCHILSFLPTEVAATTSLLSKQWRFLFASALNLEFGYPLCANELAFMDFVDRVLALRGNAIVNKFSLHLVEGVDGARADGWILYALQRNVSDLEIDIFDLLNWLGPPPNVFVTNTLVRLKIGTGDNCIIPGEGDVNLPSLKTLYLDDVQFEDDCMGFIKLLSGCPVLEELIMRDMNWYDWEVCCVSSTTLKRIRICWESYDDDEDRNGCPKSVSFDTPNLLYLKYTDDNASTYPTMKYDTLAGAKIRLRRRVEQQEENVAGDATDFLKGICNVKYLYLCSDTLEVPTFCCEQIPVFKNLSHLKIQSDPELGWESLPALFDNCSNLETLVFQGIDHRCGDLCLCKDPYCLSASPVKVLKIFECGRVDEDDQTFLEQVSHFLETMPNLKELIIYCRTSSAVSEVSKKLEMIPGKASPKCKTQVLLDRPWFS